MVWDNRDDKWYADKIGRPTVRVEIPFMFKVDGEYLPMTREDMKAVANVLRELAVEIDRKCSYGIHGGNTPSYPLGDALGLLKQETISCNRKIKNIERAAHAAATYDPKVVGIRD